MFRRSSRTEKLIKKNRRAGGIGTAPSVSQPHAQSRKSTLPVDRQQVEVVVEACQDSAYRIVLFEVRAFTPTRQEQGRE